MASNTGTTGRARLPAWIGRVAAADGPIYLAVADAIAAAITAGELSEGERLPTHRALAEALGVDLTTVTRAYAEARRRGLLEATVGRGTFVRPREPEPAPSGAAQAGSIDLGMNMPPPLAAPSVSDLVSRGLASLLAQPDAGRLLTYRSGAGTGEERAAAAHWLKPTLGEVDPDRLLISAGAQPALLAVLAGLASRGDTVLTDRHTYPGFRLAAAQLGVRLVPVAADADGLVPDAVAEACARTPRPKALYCIPTIHNPTAVTMPVPRREALADTARRHGLTIIEDDAYGQLPATPLPALAAIAPDVTVHVATVSKVMFPALRIAFVTAPDLRQGGRLAAALRANVLMPSPLLTGLTASWIEDGTAEALTGAIRREAAARQRIARDVLPEGGFDAHPEGLHLWLRLPAHWDRLSFIAHLQRHSALAVVPSDAFAVADGDGAQDTPACEAVRISLGAAATRERLREALRSVARALAEDAPPRYAEVV